MSAMLHSVEEVAQKPVVGKLSRQETVRRKVQYAIMVMAEMQQYSIKINRSSDGWLSMDVCMREMRENEQVR